MAGELNFKPRRAPSAKECLDAIIYTKGNIPLAAEYITTHHDGYSLNDPFTKNDLVVTLAADPTILPVLQNAIQTIVAINALEAASKAHDAFTASIPNIDADDVVKNYHHLLNAVREIVDQKTSTVNMNIQGQVFTALPPELQAAIELLVTRRRLAAPDAKIIDVEPTVSNTSPDWYYATDDE